MGVFVAILIVAALVFGVWWNHRNAGIARQGISFAVPYPPAAVADAIIRSYNVGAKAAIRTTLGGVVVTPLGQTGFATSTKWGDSGEIAITRDSSGSLVTARALNLYVGSHPKTHNMRGSAITHNVYSMLGITPFAARFNRWHRGLEGKINKSIQRAAA